MDENQIESRLADTPYLVGSEPPSRERFATVQERSSQIRERALDVNRQIEGQAQAVLAPFKKSILADLVTESNRIEGYVWTKDQVEDVVTQYRGLLNAPAIQLMEAIRSESRVIEVLGLYKAHSLATEWALENKRPREFEIRALHELITSGKSYAGSYRDGDVAIGGSSHVPSPPWDIPRQMSELATWWEHGSGDPVLDATVVHAWLTHIHPFQDGNGRMARLLANLALVQGDYPPLLVRSTTDRGEYYEALAESDAGDLLPLWDLFTKILRRTVKTMSRPNYIQDVLEDRLLAGIDQKYRAWTELAEDFVGKLRSQLTKRNWNLIVQGYPDLSAFSLLASRHPEGNSWFLKITSPQGEHRWLLWYGFNSNDLLSIYGRQSGYPSIFLSQRDDDPAAVHPYRPVFQAGAGDLPSELVLRPLGENPVVIHSRSHTEEVGLKDAAIILTDAITA